MSLIIHAPKIQIQNIGGAYGRGGAGHQQVRQKIDDLRNQFVVVAEYCWSTFLFLPYIALRLLLFLSKEIYNSCIFYRFCATCSNMININLFVYCCYYLYQIGYLLIIKGSLSHILQKLSLDMYFSIKKHLL